MQIKDAAKLLGLSGNVTPEDVKKAYRQAAMKYHPDRNPAGSDMMKVINAAYEVLKDFTGEFTHNTEQTEQDYPEALNDALNAIVGLDGLNIEICGAWVWVSGATYNYKTILKDSGFKFAPKKKSWYFRPEDWSSSSRGSFSMDDIRDKFGSNIPEHKKKKQLQEYAG